MASKDNNTECMITSWGIAAFAGFVAMIMLFWMADFSALQAIFMGGLIGTVLGVVLMLTVCSTQTAAADLASADKPAVRYAAKAAEQKAENAAALKAPPTAGAAAGSAPTVENAATTAKVGGPEAGTVLDGASDTSAPTGTTSAVSSSPADTIMTSQPEVPAKKDAKAAPKPKSKAAPVAAPTTTDEDRPAGLLSAARPEGKDDLKLISGVGPKLEETLNELGVYHFDQVAKFDKADIEWVDARLRFKGRIERDDWMTQARILAQGGETEFSKGKKKT
jgi:predicted flap endonuclease-1-like 5' DNA nuclease